MNNIIQHYSSIFYKLQLKILYFLVVTITLFFSSFQQTPRLFDDSYDYIELAKRISLTECFTPPKEMPGKDLTLLEYIQRDLYKEKVCFWGMHRPFIMPLILRLLGNVYNFNLFQNLIRSLAWCLLSFSIFFLDIQQSIKVLLHISILAVSYHVGRRWGNDILTENLNLSLWIINIALFIMIIYKIKTKKGVHLALLAIHLIFIICIFLRDANAMNILVFAMWLYFGLYIISKQYYLLKLTYIVPYLCLTIMAIAINLRSIEYTQRYLHNITNQIIFYLDGDYNPWDKNIYPYMYQYDLRDSDWFFKNYPEIYHLGVPPTRWEKIAHPFISWQIKNAKKVWIHYLMSHIYDFFLLLIFWLSVFMKKYLLLPIPIFIAYLFLHMKDTFTKYLLPLMAILIVIMIDFFVALIGDCPVELHRHANLAISLCYLLFIFSAFFVAERFWRQNYRHLSFLT